jgi:hypothetical protein
MATFSRLIGVAGMVLVSATAVIAQVSQPSEAERVRAQTDMIRSRQAIATMEMVLQRAISNGAEMVQAQVSAVLPTQRPRLSNTPRVNGVRLPGYGVVFNVQVPGLDLPIMWDLVVRNNQTRELDTSLTVQRLQKQVLGMPPGPMRAQLQDLIFQLEMQLGAAPRPAEARGPVTAASLPLMTVDNAPIQVDPQVVDDPEAAYTRAVKAELIDSMLVHSQQLSVGQDEWLAIWARRATNPLVPGDSIDASTWVMRVKGSVLAGLRASTITKEEAQKQVEVTEQ